MATSSIASGPLFFPSEVYTRGGQLNEQLKFPLVKLLGKLTVI